MWQDLVDIAKIVYKNPTLLARLKNILLHLSYNSVEGFDLTRLNWHEPIKDVEKVADECIKGFDYDKKYNTKLYKGPPLDTRNGLIVEHIVDEKLDTIHDIVKEVEQSHIDLIKFEENPNDVIIVDKLISIHNVNTDRHIQEALKLNPV